MRSKSFETKKVYITLSLITLVAATLALLITNGKLFQILFFIDPDDTGMDFFNSLIEVHTRKPYYQYGVLYPPLANLFFYILQLFIPDTLKANWPASHDETKLIVGTYQDARLMQSAMVLFLMFLILSLFVMAVMIHSSTKSYLLTFCLIFSAGTLQAIERGNLILIAFILTLFFIKHYNDDNRLTSELALIALACAFGFKLYPCVFGILLLLERKWGAACRTILYAVLVTILPVLVFEGPSSLSFLFENILGVGKVISADNGAKGAAVDDGMSLFLHWAVILCLGVFLLAMIFLRKKKPFSFLRRSQILFLITYAALLITNGTGGYNLIFFIIPFLAFLQEEKNITRNNVLEFLIYLICLLPVGINEMNYLFFLFYLLGCICRLVGSAKNGTDDGTAETQSSIS